MLLAFGFAGGNANKYFAAVLGLAISTTTISYLAIFPALIKLRMSHPHVHRSYSVPGGMAGVWIVGILTTAFAFLATVGLLWPGFGTDNADSALPTGFVRGDYELTQILPLVVLFAVGVLFYVAGSRTRATMVKVNFDTEEPIASG